MKNIFTIITSIFLSLSLQHLQAQITYPYPVKNILLFPEGKPAHMSYMDVKADAPSGKAILLLHGKNFNGYYWKDVIAFLKQIGYRVIVPDQIGWGKSDHPDLHYSFSLLAVNTKQLLDSLGIKKIVVLGHSMGGMLATRFTLMFPETVEKLILEDPIGLEDYKTFVPFQPLEKLIAKEKKATYESYKKYQQTYYPVWQPEYEQYVEAQAADLSSPDFANIAIANAVTYQMITEQPVCYEFSRIKVPTLLIIGLADRTVVGKDLLSEEEKTKYGQYRILGKKTQQQIKGSILRELPGVGHVPHIQKFNNFKTFVDDFLK